MSLEVGESPAKRYVSFPSYRINCSVRDVCSDIKEMVRGREQKNKMAVNVNVNEKGNRKNQENAKKMKKNEKGNRK